MKKLLCILLIAAISCSIVEDLKSVGIFDERDDEVLKGLPDFFKRLWDKIVDIWNNIIPKFKELIQWLKDNNYWDSLIDIIQKQGTKYGTDFCSKYLDHDLCADLVGWIFSLLDSL